jgi:predicted RNase H-like nuclease (RuvC/YqgF family)
MSIISSLAEGPLGQAKLIIGAVVIALAAVAISGTLYYIHHLRTQVATLEEQKNTLEANNKILQENNIVLKDNAMKFSEANQTNLGTVKSLLSERAAAQKVINDLALASQNDKKVIASLNGKIDDMLKDPKNDGAVAPVLRETIRGVQNEWRQ